LLLLEIITRLEKIRKQNLQTFNEIATEYRSRRRSPWIECVKPLTRLGRNSIILDVGAGTGRQSIAIAREELNVVAVDFAVNMLKQLDKDITNADIGARVSRVAADIVAQPFRDGAFDGIEMVAALHHVPTRRLRLSTIREILRITREGGHAIVSVWFRSQRGFYRALITSAFHVLIGRSEWGDVYVSWDGRYRFYHLFTVRELKSLFSASGFRIEGIEVRTFGQDEAKRINRNILLQASKI
jgi:tRNA (uracil-5-)-methyltransferase TRM9